MTEKTEKKIEIAIRHLCDSIALSANNPGDVTAGVNQKKAEAVRLLAEALAADRPLPVSMLSSVDGMTAGLKG